MIEVRTASGPSEIDDAMELRRRVFVGQQGVTLEADRDGRDPEALHIVAVEDGVVVGTCRLVFDEDARLGRGTVARLGRMAVEDNFRGRGLGARILEVAETASRSAGADRIRLHAQIAARSLYERGGFEAQGVEFMEEGIPHLTMEKPLA